MSNSSLKSYKKAYSKQEEQNQQYYNNKVANKIKLLCIC